MFSLFNAPVASLSKCGNMDENRPVFEVCNGAIFLKEHHCQTKRTAIITISSKEVKQ